MSNQNDYGNIPTADNNDYGNFQGSQAGSQPAPAQPAYEGNYGNHNQPFAQDNQGQTAPAYGNQAGYPATNQPPSYAGAMGYNNGVEPEKPATPKSLKIASWLIYATVLAGLIGTIIQLSNPDALMQQAGLNETDLQGTGMSAEDMEKATTIGAWVGGIIAIIQYALTIMFTIFMLKGANWARIVLTILLAFSVFNIFAIPLASFMGYSMAAAVTSTIGGLLALGAIIFMFLRPSNEFFRKMRERKQWLAFNQYR